MSATDQKIFEAIVQREGSFTFVAISFSPREAWGAIPRYHVTGTINGCAARGCLGVLGQDYFLRLGAAWLRNNGIGPGEHVTVALALEDPHEDNLAVDIG